MTPATVQRQTVTEYLLSELRAAGCVVDLLGKARPGYGDPWKNVLWVHSPRAVTLWVTLHRTGEHKGKVEIDGYSEPFDMRALPQVGPALMGKIKTAVGV
jgi:hypothetical protein